MMLLGCPDDYVIFNSDGSAELVMSGINVQNLGWKRGTVNVAGVEYEGFTVDYYGTIYNFAIPRKTFCWIVLVWCAPTKRSKKLFTGCF